ncbi:MAG: hypothetical protein ACREO9_07185, partial [Lysobacterales bacterium]
EFGKRCISKMRSVVRSGRTIIFVSHDLDALEEICDRAILIRNGGIAMDGPPDRVVAEYLDSASLDDPELPESQALNKVRKT